MVPPSFPHFRSIRQVRADVHRLHRASWSGSGFRLVVCGCALTAIFGCQLFSRKSATNVNPPVGRTMLSTLKPAHDSIQFDVVILDRRADDPLVGPQLWQEMDQVGAVTVETRELLQQNGVLVGHAAAKPPTPLLKLMGLAPEIDGFPFGSADAPKPKLSGRTYTARSGTESEIQVSDLLPEAELTIIDPGETRVINHQQVRFVFRLKPIRLQDGWVRMEFLPEIHHGDLQLRPTPSEELGWMYKSTQHVIACHPQKFGVTLNVGESAVVSSLSGKDGMLGANFFRRDQNGELRQRVLVVRLANMGRTAHPLD